MHGGCTINGQESSPFMIALKASVPHTGLDAEDAAKRSLRQSTVMRVAVTVPLMSAKTVVSSVAY